MCVEVFAGSASPCPTREQAEAAGRARGGGASRPHGHGRGGGVLRLRHNVLLPPLHVALQLRVLLQLALAHQAWGGQRAAAG